MRERLARRVAALEEAQQPGHKQGFNLCVLELPISHDAWSRDLAMASAARRAAVAEHEARTGETVAMVIPPKCTNYEEWVEMRRQFQERYRNEQA